ncbi:hypothetical protein [Endozoicomonas sp. ALC020]|uniref:hypothetical protein n=1 Tax=unclassified Endozoicomonas TaxID=2644528 RepID=UPI003BB223EE
MDLKTQHQQSIKPEKEYSAFFLTTTQPGWGSILEAHHNRQMPFIMDGEGFMLFASELAKQTYEGLTDGIKVDIRRQPDLLKLHSQSVQSDVDSEASLNGDSASKVLPTTVRPLSDLSDQDLIREHFKDNFDAEALKTLLEELSFRSSSAARIFQLRVRERLETLPLGEAEKVPLITGAGLISPEAVAEVTQEEVTAEGKVETKASRPFIGKSVQQLETLYWQAYTNRHLLEKLYEELQHRSVIKCNRLRDRVRGRLSVLDREEPQGMVEDSLSEVVKDSAKPVLKNRKSIARPYVGKTIAQLKILHLSSVTDATAQQAILAELKFFSTTEAIKLRELVQHKLNELRNSPAIETTVEQADFEKNDANSDVAFAEPIDDSQNTIPIAADHGRTEQQKKIDAVRLVTYKKRLLEGREPTADQLAVFGRFDKEAQADFLTKVALEKQLLANRVASEEVPFNEVVEEVTAYSTSRPKIAELLSKRANVFELAKKVKERATALEPSFSSSAQVVERKTYGRGQSLDNDYVAEGFAEYCLRPVLEEPAKPLESQADFTKPYARVQAMIQKELDRRDFQILLKLSVQDRRLNDVGNELGLSRRDVKRRVKELVERIGEQFAEPLKAFAEPMDALLDEEGGEVLLKQAAEKLGLTLARMKFLVMVAGAHFRQPCKIHQDRAYRPTRLLD